MHVVEIRRVETTMDQQASELLEYGADLRVNFDERAIAHEQGAHCLQRRNLNRKVERCDDNYRAVRPAIAARLLARMVARVRKSPREEPHTVSGEILEEHACNPDFGETLLPAFRHDALCQFREILFNLFGCQ